jgi:TonB-dependent SusC/RagA subfamily outer membrane receptor
MRTARIDRRVRTSTAASLLSLVVPALLAGCLGGPAVTTVPAAARDTVQIGYGTVTRGRNTSSVGSMQSDDVSGPVSRVEEMMQGRFAGVQVSPDGRGGYSIRIRGSTSLHSGVNTEPLIVIDGMPMQGYGNVLNGLSPHDIERIDVLKDAAATAIYGSRGANGVILITSKRSRKEADPQ